jgi:hypothetical protein
MRVIPVDVYDKDGNLTRIDVQDASGEFVLQMVWDENDEQTSENRELFRKWAYDFLEKSKGYEVSK